MFNNSIVNKIWYVLNVYVNVNFKVMLELWVMCFVNNMIMFYYIKKCLYV